MNRMPTSGLRCHKWHVSQTCPSPGASFSIGNSNQCFNCSVRDQAQLGMYAMTAYTSTIIHENSHFLDSSQAARPLILPPPSVLPECHTTPTVACLSEPQRGWPEHEIREGYVQTEHLYSALGK